MTKRNKRLEREVVDCLEVIKALPAEWIAPQRTAGQMFGGALSVSFDPGEWNEVMRRVSPTHATSEDVSCYRTDKKAYKKFTVYKIGDRLFRTHSNNGFHPRSRWEIERLSKGEWRHCDSYTDDYWREAEKLLVRAWNKRRREAIRALKGQTMEEALSEKEQKKLASIEYAKKMAMEQAMELSVQLSAFAVALQDGTVTQAQCAALYGHCQEMGVAQKTLRQVMGVRMPKE